MEKEEVRYTKNGVPVYTYRNPHQHGFYLSLFVRAGSMYERAENAGITHFLEHIAIRNVNAITGGNLYAELDRRGLEFNASTYTEMIQFYISGSDRYFCEASDFLTRLLSPIVLSAREIATERRRIKAEIRESDDKNSLAAFTANLLYGGTPLAGPIVGTNKSVDRISVTRLEAYRRSVFTKDNMFFYVTGNFTEEDLLALVENADRFPLEETAAFHENMAPVSDSFGKRGGKVFVKNADFTMLRFNFDLDMTKVSAAECDLLYDMLLAGYNSAFFMEMSERRGLFYDVTGSLDRYRNIGNLNFTFEVKEKDLYDAAELTVSVLSDLRERVPREEECMRASYVDNAYVLYDEVRDFNFTYGYENHILNLGYRSVEDRIRAYRAVTPERLRAVAAEVFRPENLLLTLKANKKRVDRARLEAILAKLA